MTGMLSLVLVLALAISGAMGGVADTFKELRDGIDVEEIKEAVKDKFASFDAKQFSQATKSIWTDVRRIKTVG